MATMREKHCFLSMFDAIQGYQAWKDKRNLRRQL